MTISSVPEFILEGIQTVVPMSVTNTKISFKVSIDTFNQDIFNKYGHILLCYKKLGNEESGMFHSGWFKESLGRSVSKHPILGGRIQRLEDGGFEIMSNDCGVRVIEIQAPVTLEEFLSLKRSEREEATSALLHFKEVDEENLHYSPLLYFQVTGFKCGGYSLGITYNLLLADPFLMETFLREWTETHISIVFASEIPKMPLFYLPNIKRMGSLPQLIKLTPSKDITTNVVMFEVTNFGDPNPNVCNSIVLASIEEAEGKTCTKMSPNFTLLVKELSGDIRVDVTSKTSLVSHGNESKYPMKCLGWDDLGTNNVAFWKGNVATLVSHYVGSLGLDGLVFLVISAGDEGKIGMKVIVTFPNQSSIPNKT